jgi:hypothetical protein
MQDMSGEMYITPKGLEEAGATRNKDTKVTAGKEIEELTSVMLLTTTTDKIYSQVEETIL